MKLKQQDPDSPKPRVVNFEEFVEKEGNRGRYLDIPAISQLQDSLIARGWGEPQRLAILATSAQEMGKDGAASRGIGGNGYLGYSSQRMPISYLSNTPDGRAEQIHFLIEDLLVKHPNNWLGGGKGGPYLKNGVDAYDKFWNSNDVNEATQIFNKSVIRPAGGLNAWKNRAKVAEDMEKHSYQKGGLIYKPFISEKSFPEYQQEELNFNDFLVDEQDFDFPIEPVSIFKPIEIKETIKETPDVSVVEITNVPETNQPVEEYQPAPLIPRGVVEYKNNGVDVGNMQELIDLMQDEGISFRITSGNRPGSKTSNGSVSHHSTGNALDITPIKGQTWSDLINQMKNSKRFIEYMREHNLGILDERSKQIQAKTGATGAHFHIGPDKNAILNFRYLIG